MYVCIHIYIETHMQTHTLYAGFGDLLCFGNNYLCKAALLEKRSEDGCNIGNSKFGVSNQEEKCFQGKRVDNKTSCLLPAS